MGSQSQGNDGEYSSWILCPVHDDRSDQIEMRKETKRVDPNKPDWTERGRRERSWEENWNQWAKDNPAKKR